MNNFDFYNPTHLVFGKERLGELDNLIPPAAKVLVLYGGGSVKKFGTLAKVLAGLKNHKVVEFGGIEPNPQFTTLMKAVDIVKKENIDFLLAVGGGSVIDGTKFISLAAKYERENPEELLKFGFTPIPGCKAVPLGTVVTIPATGSEMNNCAVISYNHGKYVIYSAEVFPKFSFLDPTITFSLPATQVANGVVDAFIHTTEQYLTFPVDGRFQDRTAEGIMQTLIEIGRTTIDEPTNYEARANLVVCATMALNGLTCSGVPQDWTSHMIGHELTAIFGIDHGKTLAVLLPAVLTVLKEQKRAKLLQYAERIWNITDGDEASRVDLAISKTREFFESLGIKTRLADYNVTEDKIDDVVKALQQHGMTALSESGKVTLEVSRKILEGAM
ncbi:MAG: NADH-dependent butanol dehydrogenase [Firmicutes bacterium]|nr:NADH-dependent butanol dehydrogenase [Bacillota bacterium]